MPDILHTGGELFRSYAPVYTELFAINLVLSGIIIFIERKKPTSTLLWVMTINFFPIFGFIIYLILGQDLSRRKLFREKKDVDRGLHRAAMEQLKEIEEGTYPYLHRKTARYKDMIEMFNRAEGEVLTNDNKVEIFTDGEKLFPQLFKDIEEAKEAVYVQYYIFKSDHLGNELIELLKKKAREGLDVNLVVDGMGAREFKMKDRRALEEAGVTVGIFFQGIIPRIPSRINFRNHRKISVIDHQIGYVGGFNLGDEYINRSKKMGYWRDTHLRIQGPAVNFLQWRFYLDYRFSTKKSGGGAFRTQLEFKEQGDVPMVIATSGPDTKANAIRNGYDKIIMNARKDVYIQTPYFVPDDGLFNSLKIALLSGVRVHIMIPQIRDHPFVHWAALSYIGELLEYGAQVYMYQGGFLHGKIVLADDFLASVGTANFDIRSFELNFEVNAFIFDEQVTKALVQDFWEDVKKSKHYTMEDYLNRSYWVKAKESVSRLLSPVL